METLRYCLAVAAHKYDVQLHGFVRLSNHYHIVLTDVSAQLPDFIRDMNSLIWRALNALRGIRGQNFERKGYNAVVVSDGAKMLRHCAYTEANPCRANLVDLAQAWESVTSASLEYGETVAVPRPTYGLWGQAKTGDKGNMDPNRAMHCGRIKCPEVASFRLVRPPNLSGLSDTETRAQVRAQVKEMEDSARARRKEKAYSVMDMERVKEVHYTDAPSNHEFFFGTEPTVSDEDPEKRKAVKRHLREFIKRYRHALDEFREKEAPGSLKEPGG